jgi:branched-chain amino acid transport system substrate-binding protein
MVPDYAPGWDSEKSFSRTFEHGGGKILAKIRMPFSTHDYVPYLNRAKLLHPDALFGFLPGGGSSYQFLNAYNNSGLHGQNVPYLGMTETTENVLQKYGDAVLGLVTVNYYSGAHRSAANDEFKKALAAVAPEAVAAPFQVSAFDGMYVIAHMIAATHGKKDGDKAVAAAAGLRWEAPQGPVEIDPKTHDFIQNIYVRRVEKDASGLLYNKEIGVYPLQPDYGRKGTPIPTVESLKMKPIAAK